ncbi:MAG: glycosyltransferase family 4 protein [Candidatus Thiodiazotropha sp. (ex Monitilora ramsayi)]|nr:glycosyltransferase family 4 protein [Candidatus Thiodiazotropha sp. (ex Monitilora ramsayi)]
MRKELNMPTVIRYFGSYLKSPRMVEQNIIFYKPIIALNWKVCMVLERPPENKEWLDRIKELGVEIEYMPRPKRNFDLLLAYKVFKLCRKYRTDVIHCENMHTSPLIGAFFARTKVRLWTKRSMNLATELGRKPTLRDKVAVSTRLSAFLSTKILAVSNKVKEELLSLSVPDKKVLVYCNPFTRGRENPHTREGSREKYGYKDSDIVLVSIGHTVHVKGWDVLLEAFSAAHKKNKSLKLLFVGSFTDDHEKETYIELKKIIDKSGISENVKFIGYMYDIQLPLKAADIFVLSSRAEGFGNVILEALSEKLPCISTDVGIASQVIKEGKNGYIVNVNNKKNMSEKILQLVNSKELRGEFSKNAVVPDFILDSPQYAERNAKLYQQLIGHEEV